MTKFNDDFDSVLLRSEYLNKIPDLNKFAPYVTKYSKIAKITSKNMYEKLRYNFEKVGLDVEDIESLSNVYILAYMGLYSIKYNPIKREKMINNYKNAENKEPTEAFLESYEKNCLINFLRQRLYHAYTVCERKSRNVVAQKEEYLALAATKDSIKADKEILLKEYKKYNYRKVKQQELKEIKNNCHSEELCDKDGFKVIEITIYSTSPYEFNEEFSELNYENSPESILLNEQEQDENILNEHLFESFDDKKKIKILNRFVKRTGRGSQHKENRKTAKKMLQNLKKCSIL